MADPIVYIVGSYPVLTEKFIQREVEGLRKRGVSIEVIGVNNIGWMRCMAAILLKPLLAMRIVRKLIGESCALRQAISAVGRALVVEDLARDAKHIHAHFLGLPSLVAYCLSERTGVPYSMTAHARDIYAEHIPEVVVRGAAFRTTCTESNRKYLATHYPDAPFTLVRHGIDASQYHYESPVRTRPLCRLLAVGRFVEKKGFEHLVQACGILNTDGFPFHCIIIGEGPEEEALLTLRTELALHDKISLLKFMSHDDLKQHYYDADLLVVPSIVASDSDRDGDRELYFCGLYLGTFDERRMRIIPLKENRK